MKRTVNRDQYDCIHAWIEHQVAVAPDAIAVIFGVETYSYRQLNEQANKLARHLQNLGVKPETLVGICVGRSPVMLVAMLAVLKAGGAYVPIDPTYPRERVALMLEDSRVQVILSQQQYCSSLSEEEAAIVYLDTHWPEIDKLSAANPHSAVTAESLAYVIYTSGSTGKPKGVMIEHRSLVNFAQAIGKNYELTAADRVLQFASISFDVAVEEIFVTLVTGGTLVLRSQDMLRSIPAFLETCEEWDLTVLNLPTAFWHRICAELPRVSLPNCVRLVVIGSERAVPRWLEAWKRYVSDQVRLINAYGPTEATVTSTLCDLAGPDAVEVAASRVLPIGRPITQVQAHVLDDELRPVELGQPGELYISGVGLARGYLNRPELTKQHFISWGESGKRLYKTGDIVRYREDGCLEFLDRVDHQEKIRGFRVELREIEAMLAQHPAVAESVLVAREDIPGERRLAAYVVPRLDEPQAINLQKLETEQLTYWRTVHDQRNSIVSATRDSSNASGQVSSRISEWQASDIREEESLKQTISRILALRPQRVLEIGCGTGALLSQLAPHCEAYTATDFSQAALRTLREHCQTLGLSNVKLELRAAHQLNSKELSSFDTVVLHSVVQYFPSVSYLLDVLENIFRFLKPGGSIFIGDVRDGDLLPTFITCSEINSTVANLSGDELLQRIQKRLRAEEKLALKPEFFYALKQRFPQLEKIQINLKHGDFTSDENLLGYDVILSLSSAELKNQNLQKNIDEIDWKSHELSLSSLQNLLSRSSSRMLNIRNIPNSLTYNKVLATQRLFSRTIPATAKEIKDLIQKKSVKGINPHDLCQLAQRMGYVAYVTRSKFKDSNNSNDFTGAHYDVWLGLKSSEEGEFVNYIPSYESEFDSAEDYANEPVRTKLSQFLLPQLRSYLQDKLPSYMVPAVFVLMESLPLTPNGKIDRRALPVVGSDRPALKDAFLQARTSLEKELVSLWSTLLGINEIGINDNFFELGGDSLKTTQLICHIEEAYQVVIPLIAFFRFPTISGLSRLIQSTDSPDQDDYMSLQQLASEVRLDPMLKARKVDEYKPPKNIFLTGATGFVGSFLLYEILQKTSANVYCLLRAKTLSEGRHRLFASLEKCGHFPSSLYSRIVPVLGDLSQPSLGLTSDDFKDLARVIDVIYHGGASVNLLYPYTALRATNVAGTHEVLRLAFEHHTKPVHYVSTLDVFESLATTGVNMFYEQDSIAQGHGISGGYAQSKWVAEQLVHQARECGLPVSIYRPGMASGHSHSGLANPMDLLSRFIKSLTQLKKAPNLALMLDMTPVDYVSQGIFDLSIQPELLGGNFHLINSRPLPLDVLVQGLNERGYEVQTVPYSQWENELKSRNNELRPLASALSKAILAEQKTNLELWLSGSDEFDCFETAEILRKRGVACPIANRELLATYLSFFEKIGFLSSPTSLVLLS